MLKFGMSLKRQIEIMEKQLSHFDNIIEKMSYMSIAFDPDPEYTKEARNIVRSNLCRELEKHHERVVQGNKNG